MADKRLKISADTSEVRKSLLELSKVAKRDLGKSDINLFSKETQKLLKGEAKKAMEDLDKSAKRLRQRIDKQAESLKKTVKGTKEYNVEMSKLLRLSERLYRTEKQRGDFTRISQKGMGASVPKGLGGMMGRMGMGKLGGMMTGGAAMLGGPLGILLALLMGGGLFAGGRMKQGFGMFEQGAGTRMALRGRGVRDFGLTRGQRGAAAEAGLDLNTLMQQRMGAMEAFGRQGAGTQQVIQRSKFERAFGLETGTFSRFGGQFRQVLGGGRANEATMKLQASLIASGIDDAIGPYLETASNLLLSINENGLTNNAEILGALSTLIKETGEAPEVIARQLRGIDSTLRASVGERNAFAQVAFAQAGIGGRTIGGTQAAIRSGGLFGADLSGLTPEQRQTLNSIGIGKAGFRQRSRAMLDQFKSLGFNFGPGASAADLVQSGRGAMGFLGAENEVQGIRMLELLQQGAKGQDVTKQLEEIQKDPQLKNLENINTSVEGQLDILKNINNTIKTEMGERVAPAVIALRSINNRIDETISKRIAPDVNAIATAVNKVMSFFGADGNPKVEENQMGFAGRATQVGMRAMPGMGMMGMLMGPLVDSVYKSIFGEKKDKSKKEAILTNKEFTAGLERLGDRVERANTGVADTIKSTSSSKKTRGMAGKKPDPTY